MAAGVILVILGAIFAFAVRRDSDVVNLHVVGVILLLAGAAVIWNARKGSRREREVRVVEDTSVPDRQVTTTQETYVEHEPREDLYGR